jgi:hypothetical protein
MPAHLSWSDILMTPVAHVKISRDSGASAAEYMKWNKHIARLKALRDRRSILITDFTLYQLFLEGYLPSVRHAGRFSEQLIQQAAKDEDLRSGSEFNQAIAYILLKNDSVGRNYKYIVRATLNHDRNSLKRIELLVFQNLIHLPDEWLLNDDLVAVNEHVKEMLWMEDVVPSEDLKKAYLKLKSVLPPLKGIFHPRVAN